MENNYFDEINVSSQYLKNDHETAINLLKDAFPDIEIKIINAILVASQGFVGRAFDALLSISDSNYEPETLEHISFEHDDKMISDIAKRQQIENDFIYASQLNQMAICPRNGIKNTEPSRCNVRREHSFINDELPMIRENIKQGFDDAKNKVSNFFSTIKKKIDGDASPSQKTFNSSQSSTSVSSHHPSKVTYNDHDPYSFVIEDDLSHLSLENNKKKPINLSSSSYCKKNLDSHSEKVDNDNKF